MGAIQHAHSEPAKKVELTWYEASKVKEPKPGTKEAIKLKCTCPQKSNWDGAGVDQAFIGITGMKKDIKFYLVDKDCIIHR